MSNCKNCNGATTTGQPICDTCVNNWLIMRQVIQKRLTDQYGPATRENMPAQQNGNEPIGKPLEAGPGDV
jgi:hypothetical protein